MATVRLVAHRRDDCFIQPRPTPNRLNAQKAASRCRSRAALLRRLAQAPDQAVRTILLVGSHESSRIEGIRGEPVPGRDDQPSRLYHALAAAIYGSAGIPEWRRILFRGLPP